MERAVSESRIRSANDAPINSRGHFALYWMTACRRVHWNYSLDRAVEWALKLNKPLVILEALRTGYPWASDRFHGFIMAGMRDNRAALKDRNVLYYPYVAPDENADKGLLEALALKAAIVVTDDFPAFFLPNMIRSAAETLTVRLEQVDGNGILPIADTDRIFTTAYSFRRFLQKNLIPHLCAPPKASALKGRSLKNPSRSLVEEIQKKWPPAPLNDLNATPLNLNPYPIDHIIPPVPGEGGAVRGLRMLKRFIMSGLPHYADGRNQPDQPVTSGLSPYLHFGHVSPHQVFHEIARNQGWQRQKSAEKKVDGRRAGWWGMDENAEAFLDQLITWRELGFNMCRHDEKYDRYASLPQWVRDTLEAHEKDKRPYVYALEDFENAQTHDSLWNAAQNQLVREGRIHNYLRMLWGKKILHWSASPREALDIMIRLNNRYALDGRDPNSYSGIFWVLGRYDRAWGPERPVFGKVRYMSSKNTARKIRTGEYVKKYATRVRQPSSH
ncbi:FAD binding domain of DNA photolyase [delta proteobacterium NaphS2]|nr:FAD binding domain of DNA photolyase [delta proteobacterium NaphS2]